MTAQRKLHVEYPKKRLTEQADWIFVLTSRSKSLTLEEVVKHPEQISILFFLRQMR